MFGVVSKLPNATRCVVASAHAAATAGLYCCHCCLYYRLGTAAVCRYAKFLLLRKHHLELQHPIPPLDIALLWSSHMSASGMYAADCQQLLQRPFLDLPGG